MTKKNNNQSDPLWVQLIDERTGSLEVPVAPSGWYLPFEIELDVGKEKLLYKYQKGSHKPKIIYPGAGILSEFVRLANAKPNGILEYARHWAY